MLRFLLFSLLLSLGFNSAGAQSEKLAAPKDSLKPKNAVHNPDFDAYLESQIRFTVPIMTVEQLGQLKEAQEQVIILDARSKEEYEISHIPGARRVGYDDFSVERIWNVNRKAKVVVYCGIGERSEEIAERLQNMGFKDVHNLYGSIIEWSNQGHPVVDKDGKPTKRVHIYDKNRLKWLKHGKAVF